MSDENTIGWDAYGRPIHEGDTVQVLYSGHLGIEGTALEPSIEPGFIRIERDSGLVASFDTERLVVHTD